MSTISVELERGRGAQPCRRTRECRELLLSFSLCVPCARTDSRMEERPMSKLRVFVVVACLLAPFASAVNEARAQNVVESNTPTRPRDVIFVPTREPVAEAM